MSPLSYLVTSPALLTVMLLAGATSSLTVRADYPTTVLSQRPVGYWRLNESAQPPPPSPAANFGTVGSDVDGQYLNGPLLGQPGALTNSPATSVQFFNPNQDPTYGGSKVEVPYDDRLNPQPPFSVEFWAKPSMVVTDAFCLVASLNADPAIALSTNSNPRAGWLFYQNVATNSSVNQWQFRLGNTDHYLDGDAIRGGTVTTGVWHHIAGTYDGKTAILYVNGASVSSEAISGYEPNDARPFRIGTSCFDGALGAIGTFAGNRGFDGWLEEVAFYGTVLSPADIASHYNNGRTNGLNYPSVVLAKRPLAYWRLGEAGNPSAANLGTLGGALNGQYVFSAHPGQAGPKPPPFPGFEATNLACGFDGTNGSVSLPPMNLDTNTVTITAWILANAIQTNNTGIVFCRAGTTVAGLKFDISDPNGLSYNWNADKGASDFKSSLTVPVGKWAFVGLIVQPDQATLCLQDGTQFSTAVNFNTHPEQAFEGNTLIGTDSQDPSLTFNGVIDEVAIFNRALTVGDVFSEYASAVGGLAPRIFTDLQAPAQTTYIGDTLTLMVDAGGTPPLTYVWQKDGKTIPGVTSSTFTKTNVGTNDSGQYQVLISNGQGSTNSQQATISVQPLASPSISQDPQGRTIYLGGLINLSVQATGGGLAYQWQKGGTNVVGATNATYRVDHATANDAGTYQVSVSNSLGSAPSGTAAVSVIVPAAGSYGQVITADGPEAWWRLDEPAGSTTLVDAMGRHDGVYKTGVTLGTPGVLVGDTNSAATFDGASGYAEVPYSKGLNTTNFTVECWVRADPVAPSLCPLGSFTQPPGRGYLFEKSADGLWYYFFGDGVDQVVYYISGSDAIYSAWTHLAITYDGSTFTGYVNGTLDAAAAVSLVPNNVAPFRIGYDQPGNGWNDYWSGDIDEVAFYQKALTADQIAAHYAAALYGTNSKPTFTYQPRSRNVVAGARFVYTVTANGSVPIQLQWLRNGVPLPGETNYFLVLPNLAYADSGVYQVSASNRVGTAMSDSATLAVLPTPAFANVTNGLVLHLAFDKQYLDSSGHTNNAKPVGAPAFVAGKIGTGSLHYSTTVDATDPNNKFVTSSNYVTLGTPADLNFSSNVNFSVSYWVRMTGTSGDLPFLSSAVNSFTNPGFTFAPSYQLGGWSWSLGDTATSSSIGIYGQDNSINDGRWHHLAHTFDRQGSGITYLDGFEVDSRSIVPAGDIDSGNSVSIGQDPSGAYPEAGAVDIDDVGVWRRVLNDFEVYSIYAAGQNGTSFDTYGPVTMAAALDGNGVMLLWQAGTLLGADSITGPWTPVTGATAPYFRVTANSAHKFYRVQL
jgi:hypothetical protein